MCLALVVLQLLHPPGVAAATCIQVRGALCAPHTEGRPSELPQGYKYDQGRNYPLRTQGDSRLMLPITAAKASVVRLP